MKKLCRAQVARISHLVRTFDNHRAVIEAVVNGNEKGWIIVDDEVKPTSFFMRENEGFFFLHGVPNTAFTEEISRYLFQDLKLDCIEVLISNPALEKMIPIVFGNRKFRVFERKAFHLNVHKFHTATSSSASQLPADWLIQTVNEDNLLSVDIVANGEVISHCKAMMGDTEFEISVETAEAHRRKGLATRITRELIEIALKRDMVPVWSCWTFNKASINLASRLGFEEARSVDVFLWDIHQK